MSTSETDPENDATAGGSGKDVSPSDDGSPSAVDTRGSDDTSARNVDAGGLSGLAGWLVVAVLFISGIVAPALLYWAGQTGDLQTLGLGFKNTYLAVPMIPAILLGAIGIWSALKYR